MRSTRAALIAATAITLAACQDETPTSLGADLLPPQPLTIELELPWSQFGSNLAVFGGYSRPSRMREGVVAKAYADTLNANTLVRFASYPASASVRDSDGTLRTDTDISFFGGYFVAFFDTLASTNTGPVTLQFGALQTAWHPPSATWTSAIDTVGDRRAWPEPGGGPITPMVTLDWNPTVADSVQFFLDSAQVATWSDPTDPTTGARLELLTDGARLRVVGGALRLNTRSSINPDTVPILTAQAQQVTFIYDVTAAPPADGMRVGGAPAWRTVLDVAVPAQLTGPPALCAAVGCPFTLQPRHVSYAALGLRTRQPEVAFQPTDSVRLDVRPVLARSALPKSPLGTSLVPDPAGLLVGPALFGAQAGSLVEVPITNYVRAILSGPDPAGRPPPTTIAILSSNEPSSFTFAEFFGPGGPNEPVLKLVLTVSPPMELQ